MDITKWPLNKIMQLPDHVFGRRWPIFAQPLVPSLFLFDFLLSDPLPERIVLWNIHVSMTKAFGEAHWFKLALGDHEPMNDAEFDAFERVFPGNLSSDISEGSILIPGQMVLNIPMRLSIETMGRRFALQVWNGYGVTQVYFGFTFLISSIPKEIPDCLISH